MTERTVTRHLLIRGETVVLTADLEAAARVLYERALANRRNTATALKKALQIELLGVEAKK